MKKPFLSLKKRGDVLKLLLGLALCAMALALFLYREESVAAFAGGTGSGGVTGLYGLLCETA